jgi:FkbM family methyltransferase
MIYVKHFWVLLISKIIWINEKLFFYPKLASAYREMAGIEIVGGHLTIFDIGANKGQSIKFFSEIFDKPKIYAFEPSPRTFGFLKRFIEDSEDLDVSIYQMGIGDKEQTIDFYESILSETSSFVLPNQNSIYLKRKNRVLFQNSETAFTSIPTRVTTIDVFLSEKEIENIDILKIDVEGFELEVIRGAQKALRDGKVKIVQFERHADDMREDTFPIIHDFLLSLEFTEFIEIKHPFGNFFEVLYRKPLEGQN